MLHLAALVTIRKGNIMHEYLRDRALIIVRFTLVLFTLYFIKKTDHRTTILSFFDSSSIKITSSKMDTY